MAKTKFEKWGVTSLVVYDSVNLNITLVFGDLVGCEEFQTDMWQIPSQSRKRKPGDSPGDISVTDRIIPSSIHAVELRRISSADYANIVGDASPSAECDTVSDVPSSFVSAVELTEEVKLRLLDNPIRSNWLFIGRRSVI